MPQYAGHRAAATQQQMKICTGRQHAELHLPLMHLARMARQQTIAGNTIANGPVL
jgi:hypothetical protein